MKTLEKTHNINSIVTPVDNVQEYFNWQEHNNSFIDQKRRCWYHEAVKSSGSTAPGVLQLQRRSVNLWEAPKRALTSLGVFLGWRLAPRSAEGRYRRPCWMKGPAAGRCRPLTARGSPPRRAWRC